MFHSTVISSSEREAAYVIDGLLQNEVIKSNIHSTDTHGYTENIFATTHFIHTAFAPRIKNIAKQKIYSFASRKAYENRGYKILPSRTINLWNYLYLSQLLINNADFNERRRMIEAIKRGSIITWQHINLQGEYDFTKHTANDMLFDIDRIMTLSVA